jgi:hypothetical protein
MGDDKHVVRCLAQGMRANIISESQDDPHGRGEADILGNDLRRTAASLMANGRVPRS